jgi:hypothetical protein
MKLITTVLHSIITNELSLRDWGISVIYVNSDVFGVGLSEPSFVEQWTYENDDGEMGRFIGLYGSRRAPPLPPVLKCWRAAADKKLTASASNNQIIPKII